MTNRTYLNSGLLIVATLALAACGGGGGGGSLPSVQPTATATASSQVYTYTGTVAQLAGPLSSSTWNLAAPTGCPNNATNGCAAYPPPPAAANLPGPSATPGIGNGVGGVTVYAVTTLDVNGVPSAPLATATTAPNGTFSLTTSSVATGLVAVNGTSVSATTGATNLGYTVAHVPAKAGVAATLLIDALSPDEQSGFVALNALRVGDGLNAVTSDTIAQATIRYAVAQGVGAAACTPTTILTQYATWSGITSNATQWADYDATQWAVAIPYGNLTNTEFEKPMQIAGAAALYQANGCGASLGSPWNYYQVLYI